MTTAADSPIRGLYEAHVPAADLGRAVRFYRSLGLSVAYRNERVAFVWTEPDRSWLGVWAPDPGPPAGHVAFEVSLADLRDATDWLRDRGLEPVEVNGFVEPQVRPYQANASVYFEDPFGNSLELMCTHPVEPTAERGPEVALDEWLADHPDAPAEQAERAERGTLSTTDTAADSIIAGLNEAHLTVDDVDQALAFYRDVLDLPVASRDETTAFVWTEPGRSQLGLWAERIPERHVAFEASLADLARAEVWLAERGVGLREVAGFDEPFVRPRDGIASAYFADSEGNDLELMAVVPSESAGPTDGPAKVGLSAYLHDRRIYL